MINTCNFFEGQFWYFFGNPVLVAKVRKAELVPEKDITGCNKYKLLLESELVLSIKIKRHVEMYHDCRTGRCTISETLTQQRMEQEIVSREEKHLKHNKHCNLYLLNMF